MKRLFAPGCALAIYKPHLAEAIHSFMNDEFGPMERLDLCCTKLPVLEGGVQVISVCPGCDRRYRENYPAVTTISLWEIMAGNERVQLPDYQGLSMTILDPCPARSRERVHEAVRNLISRMNIKLVEPEKTRARSSCCGDSFYGRLPVEQVKSLMKRRADEMPEKEVIVYCVSCIKSMYLGGKKPRYLVDLLWGEDTDPQIYEPDDWHRQLKQYIQSH